MTHSLFGRACARLWRWLTEVKPPLQERLANILDDAEGRDGVKKPRTKTRERLANE